MLISIVQLNFEGKWDDVVENIESDYGVIRHMKENGYTRIPNSSTFFRKGRKVRYGYHGRDINKELTYISSELYSYQEFIAKN